MAITVLTPIRLDVKQDSYIYPRPVKQNDTITLNFSVWDDNVSADLSKFTCLLKANKAKGKGYEIRDATISGNNVSIKCPSSITQFAGELLLELCFIDSANKLQKSSFNIIIEVQPTILATNDKGDLPECIITVAEKLDENLRDIEATVQKAETTNKTLTNTINNADITNSNLNNSISTGNTLKGNLDNSIATGNQTIEDLKDANGDYTNHIENMDIHVTKAQKDKWDAYEAKITELTNIIDNILYKDSVVIDDEGNFIVDDEGNSIIV